ncbi:MAG: hypothetical protein M1401_20470 [Chloroflexi bacterium]|nr:hypothetical protein [Chloroflexota bacterium]
MDSKAILVSVRRGTSDLERVLTFQRPGDIPIAALLENQLAVDGTGVRGEIAPIYEYLPDRRRILLGFGRPGSEANDATLGGALVSAERWLMGFLGQYGYSVEFE